jgi:hypothetical protein
MSLRSWIRRVRPSAGLHGGFYPFESGDRRKVRQALGERVLRCGRLKGLSKLKLTRNPTRQRQINLYAQTGRS